MQLAFPQNQSLPTELLNRSQMLTVSFHVSRELWSPVVRLANRELLAIAARVPVPEAAMHKDDFAVPGEHNIRNAG